MTTNRLYLIILAIALIIVAIAIGMTVDLVVHQPEPGDGLHYGRGLR